MNAWETGKEIARRLLVGGRRVLAAIVKTRLRIFISIAVVLVLGLRLVVPKQVPPIVLEQGSREPSKTLVVVVHGFRGTSRRTLIGLVKRLYPTADLIAPQYANSVFAALSNLDPYEIANALEQTIHAANEFYAYNKIVLFGYSMGALIIRKTLVWAYGEEQDRVGTKGPRSWVQNVDRVVSLAGMNRGWSIDPVPAKMP
jgi:pimeloyl-ACP methyl ester carboxylesterase